MDPSQNMNGKLYVSGGEQREHKRDEWHQYRKALILEVDAETGTAERRVEFTSPPQACPDAEPNIVFKVAHLQGDRLFVCTSTEVLIYQVPQFEQVGYLSLPAFNDLHHVRPTENGSLLVVNTGLDMIMEVTVGGEVLGEWSTLEESPWARFSRETDYRKVPTTKPHAAHPNFVFRVDGDLWCSRFLQRDAVNLAHPERRIQFPCQPHDGIQYDGRIYFTLVDGQVFVVDEASMQIQQSFDLNAFDSRGADLGWCRGIYPVDGDRCWVGFTRFRPTKFRENVAWLRHGFTQHYLPTRIALYDLARGQILKEIDLEPYGMNVIFGVLPTANESTAHRT